MKLNNTNGVVLFIYNDLGVKLLKLIKKKKIKIHLVITHEDKKKEKVWYSSCSEYCKKNKIRFVYYEKTNFNKIYNKLKYLNFDCIFSAYFRKLIPENILQLPKNGAINLHCSFLPNYRGRAPINWQIINGEKYSGGTIHYMNKFADKGNIIYQKKMIINNKINAYNLQIKINNILIKILNKKVYKIINGICPSIKQKKKGSYFGKRKPSDGKISFNVPVQDVYNLVRGLSYPFPGAFFIKNKKKIIIEKSQITNIKSSSFKPIYLFLRGNLYLKCIDYYLKVIKININNKQTNKVVKYLN